MQLVDIFSFLARGTFREFRGAVFFSLFDPWHQLLTEVLVRLPVSHTSCECRATVLCSRTQTLPLAANTG